MGFTLVVLLLAAGCVDINDAKVQVLAPGQVDQYQRNVLDKCPPHIYPHRLILARAGVGSPLLQIGQAMVFNQADFDKWWGNVTPDLNQTNVPSDSLKPIVNWDQQTAYFFLYAVSNTCQQVKPYGDEMVTDCYNVSIQLYRYDDNQNCEPVSSYPVFIYIYPKTSWPINLQQFYPTPTFTPTALPATPTPTPTPVPSDEDE